MQASLKSTLRASAAPLAPCRPLGTRAFANVTAQQQRRAAAQRCRAADEAPAPAAGAAEPAAPAAAAPADDKPEVTFYEGPAGSNVELGLSILLSATLIYAPLTLASIGRRLWFTFKVTNKRLIITNSSPLFKRQTQIAFSKIKEIRAVPRAFGAWGDMVIFLKDGSRLEMVGIQNYADIKRHIESCIID